MCLALGTYTWPPLSLGLCAVTAKTQASARVNNPKLAKETGDGLCAQRAAGCRALPQRSPSSRQRHFFVLLGEVPLGTLG